MIEQFRTRSQDRERRDRTGDAGWKTIATVVRRCCLALPAAQFLDRLRPGPAIDDGVGKERENINMPQTDDAEKSMHEYKDDLWKAELSSFF